MIQLKTDPPRHSEVDKVCKLKLADDTEPFVVGSVENEVVIRHQQIPRVSNKAKLEQSVVDFSWNFCLGGFYPSVFAELKRLVVAPQDVHRNSDVSQHPILPTPGGIVTERSEGSADACPARFGNVDKQKSVLI